MWIDSHCHPTAERFDADRDAVLERAFASGVEALVAIGAGYGIEGNAAALALAARDPRVFATAGVHPHDARLLDDAGRPAVVERALIVPPGSRLGPITPEQRRAIIEGSLVFGHYEKQVDRESAYEILRARAEGKTFRSRMSRAMPRWLGERTLDPQQLRRTLRYFGWPLLTGLLLALLLIERHPEWVGLSGAPTPAVFPLPALEGPVSYSRAVDRAAPAVANLYTTKVVSKPDHPLYQDPLFRHFFGESLPRQRRLPKTAAPSLE